VPNDRRIELRIGINVGDIVVEDGDIFGDGVNVAARLEALAEPGGVCVSARVQEDAAGKLELTFEDIGEQALKNIARPIRAYRVATGPTSASVQKTPALALPDKPSIAVLPFANMSGDLEQEYFADGMVEEIITALSRIRWLIVIARNSTFTYKGRAIDVKQVRRELGVRYVLEGSVRKAGARVRITASLLTAMIRCRYQSLIWQSVMQSRQQSAAASPLLPADWAPTLRNRWFADSAQEEAGFERSVPPRGRNRTAAPSSPVCTLRQMNASSMDADRLSDLLFPRGLSSR